MISDRNREEFEQRGRDGVRKQIQFALYSGDKLQQAYEWLDEVEHGPDRALMREQLSMRLDCYRNFLRICIKGDDVTIYPVGLDKVPRRDEWQINPNWKEHDQTEPAYVPASPLEPHLIEGPIVIRT